MWDFVRTAREPRARRVGKRFEEGDNPLKRHWFSPSSDSTPFHGSLMEKVSFIALYYSILLLSYHRVFELIAVALPIRRDVRTSFVCNSAQTLRCARKVRICHESSFNCNSQYAPLSLYRSSAVPLNEHSVAQSLCKQTSARWHSRVREGLKGRERAWRVSALSLPFRLPSR